MKSYCIDSIDPKLCFKTNSEILDDLKLCVNCHKLPIPVYKSYKNQEESFCKNCYFKLNFNPKHLLTPSVYEIEFLDKLIVSCRNFVNGCPRARNIKNLEDLLLHESECKYSEFNNKQGCNRCKNFLSSNDLSICSNDLSTTKINFIKLLKDKDIEKEINNIVYDSILTQNAKLKDKLMIHEEILETQNSKILEIKEIICNLQSNLENKINQATVSLQISQHKIKNKESQTKNIKSKPIKNTQIVSNNNQSKSNVIDINNLNSKSLFDISIENNSLFERGKRDIEEDLKSLFVGDNSISFIKKSDIAYEQNNFCKSLWGHNSTIYSIIQIDEKTIISGGTSNNAIIWDLMLNNYFSFNHDAFINCLLKLKDGKIASACNDKTIKIWDLNILKFSKILKGHESAVYTISQLDENKLASGSEDKTVKIWDISTGELLHSLQGHKLAVWCVIPISKHLIASSSGDKTIRISPNNNKKCKNSLIGHEEAVWSILLLNNGNLASASCDNTIRIWDLNTYKCLQVLKGHDSYVYSIIQLFNGEIASGSNDGTIKIWELSNYKLKKTYSGHEGGVCSIIQLGNGKIASSSKDTSIKIWN